MEQLAEDFEILIIAWLKSGDENVTNVAYSLAKHAQSIQLMQTAVVGQSEQLKCKCKNAKFTRTVDSDFNPLCGYCGHII